jgi:uncharacterized membrane protein (UPF0127 family)
MNKTVIKTNSKSIEIPNVNKVSEIGKVRGLMFRRKENCPALLFEFKKPVKIKIHSFFVFFPFLAVWMDNNNKILDKKIVKPWKFSISPSVKEYNRLIEIPFNKFYLSKVKSLVGQKV